MWFCYLLYIYLKKADDLSAKIERAEKVETEIRKSVKFAGTPVQKVNTDKATRGWSLFKAINEVRNGGQLTGLEAEMHQEAETEARKGLQGIGIPTMMKEKRGSITVYLLRKNILSCYFIKPMYANHKHKKCLFRVAMLSE